MTDQIRNIFGPVMHVPLPQPVGNADSYINVQYQY